MEIYFALVVES
ncbi:hypothetical protein MXB_4729 [Myxobolus squamalis]|nr:hypothetical protein MXB_4729 [Myxobolus squamalis]